MVSQEMNKEILARMTEDVPEIAECKTLDQKCRKYVDEIMHGRKITPFELRLIVACAQPGVIALHESEFTPSCPS